MRKTIKAAIARSPSRYAKRPSEAKFSLIVPRLRRHPETDRALALAPGDPIVSRPKGPATPRQHSLNANRELQAPRPLAQTASRYGFDPVACGSRARASRSQYGALSPTRAAATGWRRPV